MGIVEWFQGKIEEWQETRQREKDTLGPRPPTPASVPDVTLVKPGTTSTNTSTSQQQQPQQQSTERSVLTTTFEFGNSKKGDLTIAGFCSTDARHRGVVQACLWRPVTAQKGDAKYRIVF